MESSTLPSIRKLIFAIFITFAALVCLAQPARAQVAPGLVSGDVTSLSGSPSPVVDPTQSGTNLGAVQEPSTPSSNSGANGPTGPSGPTGPTGNSGKATFSLNFGGDQSKPSQSIVVIILITLISVAPALLIMMTSFTRIIIVLSLTRNALGVQSMPPNQVLVGLALFLSLFIMGPVFAEMNKTAIQPYLNGEMSQSVAIKRGTVPLKKFMLKHTRREELGMFIKASGGERPKRPADVSMTALVPAFIISELKTAFIIGFIVFIPFLVIDLIVSSSLMSMGMMMLPPMMVSLPFKLLLFILVDGWGLVIRSLLSSFKT